MELVRSSRECNSGMELKGVVDCSGLEKELEEFRNKYKQLEERCKNAEDKCIVLELEIQKKNSDTELLRSKSSVLETENGGVENCNRRSIDLEQKVNCVAGEKDTENIIDLIEDKDLEEDRVIQLMVENKVLECEKKRAESDAEVLKLKNRELEARILELEMQNSILRAELTPKSHSVMRGEDTNIARNSIHGLDIITSSQHLKAQNRKAGGNLGVKRLTDFYHSNRVKRKLPFVEEGNPSKKIAPSTPAGAGSSVGVIDIDDSDDELPNAKTSLPLSETQRNQVDSVSPELLPGDNLGDERKKPSDEDLDDILSEQSDQDDFNVDKGSLPFVKTPRSRIASQRKRTSNIVTTDSEGDNDDDDLPICKLKTKCLQERRHISGKAHLDDCSEAASVSDENIRESTTPRRRLVALRNCNVNKVPKASPSSDDNADIDNDLEESDTEGDSLGGFIVSSSESSDGGGDDSSASNDESDDNMDFGQVISRIRREKDHRVKWEFEADMLAAFGKDLELCMKAVCALYRQQTSDEQVSKGTFHANGRGFSQCDALRGTTLAEFLTDGDPEGDLVKSVEELQEYNPRGPELCRTLAKHYSKQLFAIYMNEEDPLFSPNMTWPASGTDNNDAAL